MKKMSIKGLTALCMTAAVITLAGCSKETVPETTAQAEKPSESSMEAETGTTPETAGADWKPEKEFTFIIPFNAGGSSDVAARVLVEYMNKYSDKDFTIVNMPGSGGQVGMEECFNAAPDGYTVVSVPTGWFMSYSMGNVDKTYSDFTPISLWADSYMALVTNGKGEYDSYDKFVEAAKSKDMLIGGVAGTLPCLAEYVMADKEGFTFNFTDLEEKSKQTKLLSNRVDAYVDAFASVVNYVSNGDLNCLAVFSDQKLDGYETVPNLEELGYDFDVDFLAQRYALWGPGDMNPGAVSYINQVIREASEDPECQKALAALYYSASWMDSAEYHDYCEKVQKSTDDYVNRLFFQ